MTPNFPDVFKWLTGRIIDAEICSEKLRVFFFFKFIYYLFFMVQVINFIVDAGQCLDNYLQLCWKLLLDPLFLHCLGRIIYVPIMEDE